MTPEESNVSGIFAQQVVQYAIPHYQRPQAWQPDKHWEPLWADVEAKANDWLSGGEPKQHYLGAIVMAKRPKLGVRGMDRCLVIDGQQRLSTLQYLLKALSIISFREGYLDGYASIQAELTNVSETMMDDVLVQRHKLWPTFRDRDAHKKVMSAATADDLRQAFSKFFTKSGALYVNETKPRPLHATWFFYERINLWLFEVPLGDGRIVALESMRKAITKSLQLIILWLDPQDDPQVIFECLNGRGEPLRPTDLIKNYLFMTAEAEHAGQEELTEESELFQKWAQLDAPIWMEEISRGRIKKTRLEWLVYYGLQAETAQDIDSSKIFQAYQKWAVTAGTVRKTADVQVDTLLSHANSLQQFIIADQGSPIGRFGKITQAFEVTTVSPLALAIAKNCAPLTQSHMFNALASYLVRREACGLVKKSYNLTFLALLKDLHKSGFELDVLLNHLGKLTGETAVWPDDNKFRQAISNRSMAGNLEVCRLLLGSAAAEIGSRPGGEVEQTLDWSKLHVEHLLPTSWYQYWPLPDGATVSKDEALLAANLPDEEGEEGKRRRSILTRQKLKKTIGNLTILNKEINMEIKHFPWNVKQNAIREVTQLRMNFDLIGQPTWNEEKIAARNQDLADMLTRLWPGFEKPTPVLSN